MDYNTSRRKLILPEYGRNVQQMVNHVKTIEDRDERNRLTKGIIQLMGSMNPQLRDVADFKHKLWDHLAIIANFDLDVDFPYDMPTPENIYKKPDRLPYRKPDDIRYKHYGRIVEEMIEKAIEYPEGEEKEILIELIGNQMKKSYLLWNRDNASDELVFADLLALSKNKLTIPEGLKLKDAKDLAAKPASPANNQRKTNNQKGGKAPMKRKMKK
jgi:hypothetical protein